MIQVDEHKVGYLSRADAIAFGPTFARVAAAGRVAYCRADILGGWLGTRRRPADYGIIVYCAPPSEQALWLDRKLDVIGGVTSAA